ncbi:MAG: FAD-dependent oxidoreductase [Pseudomonadota bacterium]
MRGADVYICPKADGQVYIGATEIENCRDLEIDNAAIMDLRRRAHAIAPSLAKTTEVVRWAGLRPTTPDKAPILGRLVDGPDNVFLALGHYRNGVLLAPATANAMAELILSGDDHAIAAFSAERFATAPVV